MTGRASPLRTRWAAVVLSFATFAAGIPAFADDPPAAASPSPTYADKPAAWWIEEMASPGHAAAAALVVKSMGNAVLQALCDALSHPRADVRATAAQTLAQWERLDLSVLPALRRALGDADPRVRGRAATTIGALAHPAAAAGPELVPLLKDQDNDVRARAVLALRAIGAAGREVLAAAVECLADSHADARIWAVNVIAQAGAEAVDFAPALIASIDDGDAAVRIVVIAALGAIGPGPVDAVPALLKARSDRNIAIAREATGALGAYAGKSKDALLALVESLSARDLPTRRAAAQALGQAGGAVGTVVPELIRVLETAEEPVLGGVARALGGGGEAARPAVVALLHVATRAPTSESVADAALRKLGAIAIPDAVEALADPDPAVRAVARRFLIAANLPEVLPHAQRLAEAASLLLRDTSTPWPEKRDAIILGTRVTSSTGAQDAPFSQALLAWASNPAVTRLEWQDAMARVVQGSPASSGAATLVARLVGSWLARPDLTPGDRYSALEILGSVGASDAAVAVFMGLLNDGDTTLARAAADRLIESETGRNALLERLAAGSLRERLLAVRVLARPQFATANRPALLRRLRDPDLPVRIAVARALFADDNPERILAPDAEDLLAVLVESLSVDDGPTREWAALRLGAFGKSAAAAVPELIRLFGDGNGRDRDEFLPIVSAIERIDHAAWAALVPTFEKGLASEDVHIRAGNLYAFAMAGGVAEIIVAKAAPLLKHDDWSIREFALMALQFAGADAAPLAQDVAALLDHRSSGRSASAMLVLTNLAPGSDVAFDALLALFRDTKSLDRGLAAAALAAFGKKAVAPLIEALRDPVVRVVSVMALGTLGPAAIDAVPALEAMALDADAATARSARDALESIREKTK